MDKAEDFRSYCNYLLAKSKTMRQNHHYSKQYFHSDFSSSEPNYTNHIGEVVGQRIGNKYVVIQIGRDRKLAEIEDWKWSIRKGDLVRVIRYNQQNFPVVKKIEVIGG